jgi:hypothetical protein
MVQPREGGTLITKRGSNLNQWAGEYYNTVPEYHQEYLYYIPGALVLPGNKGRNTKTRRYFTIPGMQLILLGLMKGPRKNNLHVPVEVYL